MYTIGLTGGIACGKSSVSKILLQNGIQVINADELSHRAIEPEGPAYHDVIKEFGTAILMEDGYINRKKLADIIFADPQARKRLESLIHPAVLAEINQAIEQAKKAGLKLFVVEIQLLFELKWEHLFDRIWVVTASAEEQLQRLQKRNGLTREEANARITAQLPLAYKEKRADAVIYNNKGLSELETQVQKLINTVE